MYTSQPLDEHSEQVSPKRLRSLYENAPPTSFNPVYAAILNNLGVDCFEHGRIPDASKCFRNAMRIFAPELPQSLCREALNLKSFPSPCAQTMTRQVSVDPTQVKLSVDDQDSPQAQGQSALPLSSSAPTAVPAIGSSSAATRTEYDEGMNSFNRPLRIDSSHKCSSHYDYQRTAPVLLFNIGQLNVLSGDDTTAANYFRYALDIINQRSTSASCIPSCPATPIQPLPIAPHSSSLPEPMDAIPILHNLGHIYYRAQNYKLAMDMYSKALVIPQQNDNLPDSASTLNCLGVIFFHMSRNSDENATKALNMLNTSLNIRKKILTYDDQISADESRREIATVMNNVGRVHCTLGDHMAAFQTYVEAYELRKELLPANHLDLAASAYNLGQTHHQLGNLDDAMTLYTEFYEAVSKYLGSSHHDVAIILKCMAQVHHDKSQYEEAAKLYYKSLTATKAALGELHPEVASTLNKIGNMFYENSDFDAAIKVYKEGLAVERAVLQSDHQNIVVTLTNIAQSHKRRGNHTAALERYTEAYNLQQMLLGPITHPKVAVTLSNVAQVSCRLGQFSRALDAYQEVLQIRHDAHGDNHVDVAAISNSIGLVLFRQGYHSLAIESFEESLRVRRLCLGDQHRDVAVVLYNVATTHLEQGDEDKAMACYAETLRVERSTLGNDHQDLVVTLQHIAQVFCQRGELDKALEYFTEVLRIEKLHHGNSSPIVARLLNKMGNIYLQKADVPNMMECFAEATRIFEASSLPSASSDVVDRDEVNDGELKITGYNFYSLSILHPECAAAA